MRKDDWWYLHLLEEAQSADREHRLKALEDLCKHEYLDLVPAQFLLDRLNATSNAQEHTAILGLMCQIEDPLPIGALMAILEDRQSSSVFLRMEVAHVLAVVQAEEALDLFCSVLLDREEHPWLRETMTGDLALWGEHLSGALPLALLNDPEPAVCAAALAVLREQPQEAIPLDLILPYLQRKEPYIRKAAIKTLMAAEQRVPIDPILRALHDPEPEVRAAASHACMSLVEWFPDQIPLEFLLVALYDEYAAVREDVLDAFGKIPLRIPVEPVIAALSDPVSYVRCAAVETLGLMGERVPARVLSTLREMAGADDSAHVRQRATRTVLQLHGLQLPPLTLPIIDITE